MSARQVSLRAWPLAASFTAGAAGAALALTFFGTPGADALGDWWRGASTSDRPVTATADEPAPRDPAAEARAWLATGAAAGVDLPTAGTIEALAAEHAGAAWMQALRMRLAAAPLETFPAWAEALWASTTSVGDRVRAARALFLFTWIDRDAAGATRWLAGFSDEERHQSAGDALLAWAERDPAVAWAWLEARPADAERTRWLARLLAAEVATDLVAARARAEAEPGEAGAELRTAVFAAWVERDPAAAVAAWGAAFFADPKHADALRHALMAWAARDPGAAWRWVAAMPTTAGAAERQSVVARELLMNTEAGKIMPAILAGPRLPRALEQAVRSRMFHWIVEDPAAGIAALQGIGDADYRTELVRNLAGRSLLDKEEASLPLVELLPAGADRDRRMSEIVTAWARREPEAALQWAEVRGGALAASTRAAVLGTLAREEPELAIAHWQSLAAGPDKARAAAQLAAGWAGKDPARAMAWLASTAAPSEPNLWRDVLAGWTRREPLAALAGVATLPAGETRDAALEAWRWNFRSPAQTPDALAAIASWPPSPRRDQGMIMIAMEWLRADFAAGAVWLESSSTFTAEQKTDLRRTTAPSTLPSPAGQP